MVKPQPKLITRKQIIISLIIFGVVTLFAFLINPCGFISYLIGVIVVMMIVRYFQKSIEKKVKQTTEEFTQLGIDSIIVQDGSDETKFDQEITD